MLTLRLTKSIVFVDDIDLNTSKKLYNLLAYKLNNVYFSKAKKNGKWDGYYRLYNPKKECFKIGFLFRVIEFLKSEGIEFEIIDNRNIDFNYDFSILKKKFVYDDIKLRDVQLNAINKYCTSINGLNLTRGVFSLPPRSGKSLIAGVLGKIVNHYPIVFVVHKIDLALQAKETFEKIFNFKIGIVGDGECDIDSPVVISTIQSICSAYGIKEKFDEKEKKLKDYTAFKELMQRVKVIMVDECHVSGSESMQSLPNIFTSVEHIIGFTGTPFREEGDDLLIEQLCGSVIYELTRQEALEKGYVLPVKVYCIHLPVIGLSGEDWFTMEKEGINFNKYLLDATVKIVKHLEKKGMSSVVIVKKKAQGQEIYKLLKCDYLHGGISGNVRKDIYNKLNNKEIKTIISTVTDIGVNIPSLDAVVLSGLSKSKISALQRIRCNTPYKNKEKGFVFLLCPYVDVQDFRKNYLRNHWIRVRNIYKDEGFEIINIDYKKL